MHLSAIVSVMRRCMSSFLPLLSVLVALVVGVSSSEARPSAARGLTYLFVPFDQFDPQRVSDGQDIAGQNLLEGLVTPNPSGTGVVPATADAWTISGRGTVYTFHIRRTARWSNGRRVTAQDFEWTYRRLLTPSTSAVDKLNGASGYPPDLGIRNALAFQLGSVTDWSKVGVRALDASRLRIVLASPNTSFLQEMTLPAMVALPKRNLTRYPFSWQTAAHWVGNGPFVVQAWEPNVRMVLVRNKRYWDRKNVHLERVTISMGLLPDTEIRSRYARRELDIARVVDPAAFATTPALTRAITHVRRYSVNFLTVIPSRNPALRDVRVRQALALAIDRREVARADPSIQGSTSLVPSTLPGFDKRVGFTANVAKARRLLAAAGYPGGTGFPTFSIMTSRDDPVVRAVLRGLGRNLQIRTAQDVESPDVYSAKRHEVQPASFAGFFSTGFTSILTWRAWVSGTYPPSQVELLSLDPDDYTHYQVLQADGTANSVAAATAFLHAHASPEALRFEAVAARADATANRRRAVALYKQAAAIRQSTYEYIPYAYRDVDLVVRPGIRGVHLWTGYFTISFKGVRIA